MIERQIVDTNGWLQSGLLDGTSDNKKEELILKLNEVQNFLNIRNGNDEVETLIYPLIVRYFNINEKFNALELVKKFIKDFKETDFEKDYLERWINETLNRETFNHISEGIFDCISKIGNNNSLGIKGPTDFFETFNKNERTFGICVDNNSNGWVKKYKVTIEQL